MEVFEENLYLKKFLKSGATRLNFYYFHIFIITLGGSNGRSWTKLT